jgi:hypothetical protein
MMHDQFSDLEDQEFTLEDDNFEGGLYETGLYEGGFGDGELYEDELYESEFEMFSEPEPEYENDLEGLFEANGHHQDGLYESGLYEDGEYEGVEFESDPFLGKLVRRAGRFIKKGVRAIKRSPILKTLARGAASVVGGALGGPAGVAIANGIAGAVLREAEYEGEAEAEEELYESELEFEDLGGSYEALYEFEDAAVQAAEADSEYEASRQIRRMVSAIPKLLRQHSHLRSVYPKLMRASAAVAKTMRANPKTRGAIRLLPVAVRRTLQQLSGQRSITNRMIIETMSRNVAWVMANPSRVQTTLRTQRRRKSTAPRRPQRRSSRLPRMA